MKKATTQAPHPALSREERENHCFPSPLGGRCPEGADEGSDQFLKKRNRSFKALMVTQFLGAFNDNVFQIVIALLITHWMTQE
nr:hypothetical protein [Elusimicrobiota bacterium]